MNVHASFLAAQNALADVDLQRRVDPNPDRVQGIGRNP